MGATAPNQGKEKTKATLRNCHGLSTGPVRGLRGCLFYSGFVAGPGRRVTEAVVSELGRWVRYCLRK